MNFRTVCILSCLTLPWAFSYSQSLFPVKEHYEAIELAAVGGDDDDDGIFMYLPFSNSNATIEATQASNLGDGMSHILESYLRMYETTRDKAYLMKFVNHAIRIQEVRGTGNAGGYGLVISAFSQNANILVEVSSNNYC